MVAVPTETPDTIPVDEPTLAMVLSLLVHIPPEVALFSVVEEPIHTIDEPVMAVGTAFTVTVAIAAQPVGNE